ncbi:MAG: hypothetical protein U9R40_04840 [Synergistota bacterium]|nr:hypothetical protein [Synergistota bacterium]
MVRGLKKKSGFALVTVLVILLILTFMSAILMDLVLNAHATSMETIQREQLYNAAQYGVEYGRALLVKNSDSLPSAEVDISGSVSSESAALALLRPSIQDPSGNDLPWTLTNPSGSNASVTVDILDCYYTTGGDTYYDYLSPKRVAGSGSGGGSDGLSQLGTSGYLDPNRNISFGGGSVDLHSYVIRSTATGADGRTFGIETLVVVSQ